MTGCISTSASKASNHIMALPSCRAVAGWWVSQSFFTDGPPTQIPVISKQHQVGDMCNKTLGAWSSWKMIWASSLGLIRSSINSFTPSSSHQLFHPQLLTLHLQLILLRGWMLPFPRKESREISRKRVFSASTLQISLSTIRRPNYYSRKIQTQSSATIA